MMLRIGREQCFVVLVCGFLACMGCGNPASVAITPAQQKALSDRLKATGQEAGEYTAQAAAAAMAGDGEQMVEATLASLEIARRLSEEPVLDSQLIRHACQSKCLYWLAHGLAHIQLTEKQLKNLADALEQAHKPDAVNRAAETELENAVDAHGCTGYSGNSVRRIMQPTIDSARERDTSELASYRVAQTVLAIERFRVAHNRLPDSLDELTPDLIKAVPVDPFTDGPLGYVMLEPGYAVHSAGQDGKLDEQLVRDAEPGRLASRNEEGMVIRR